MAKHAQLSPSSADRWMTCAGSIVLCDGLKEAPSDSAAEGTAAHFLASECLSAQESAHTHIGKTILVYTDSEGEGREAFVKRKGETFVPMIGITTHGGYRLFDVDSDMADDTQRYIDYVNDVVKSTNGTLYVEQRMSLAEITGEEGAEGTSDSVIITPDGEIIIIDLKFGRGIQVDAKDNRQLKMYALAAYNIFSMLYDISSVRLVIHQPRLFWVSEEVLPIDALVQDFQNEVDEATELVRKAKTFDVKGGSEVPEWEQLFLQASDKGCQWCKAKALCPEAARHVAEAIEADFEDLTEDVDPKTVVSTASTEALSTKMKAIEYIESWCKAVRAMVETKLFAGEPVEGYKLVQGKKGSRAWDDPEEVEKMFKAMRLKNEEMYVQKVITPTVAEKVLKAKPKCWAKVQPRIVQAEGGFNVVPESDKREAIVVGKVEDDMEDLTDGSDML